jgi:hypothetical protein
MVADAMDSSGAQWKDTSTIGSRYRAMASEDVIVDTSVCVVVNCKV